MLKKKYPWLLQFPGIEPLNENGAFLEATVRQGLLYFFLC
jgi:hypothetical protein